MYLLRGSCSLSCTCCTRFQRQVEFQVIVNSRCALFMIACELAVTCGKLIHCARVSREPLHRFPLCVAFEDLCLIEVVILVIFRIGTIDQLQGFSFVLYFSFDSLSLSNSVALLVHRWFELVPSINIRFELSFSRDPFLFELLLSPLKTLRHL